MNDMQKYIVSLTMTAFDHWTDGTERPLFPPSEDAAKTHADIIWNTALNAMAYGVEHGMERGYQIAKEEGS